MVGLAHTIPIHKNFCIFAIRNASFSPWNKARNTLAINSIKFLIRTTLSAFSINQVLFGKEAFTYFSSCIKFRIGRAFRDGLAKFARLIGIIIASTNILAVFIFRMRILCAIYLIARYSIGVP